MYVYTPIYRCSCLHVCRGVAQESLLFVVKNSKDSPVSA